MPRSVSAPKLDQVLPQLQRLGIDPQSRTIVVRTVTTVVTEQSITISPAVAGEADITITPTRENGKDDEPWDMSR